MVKHQIPFGRKKIIQVSTTSEGVILDANMLRAHGLKRGDQVDVWVQPNPKDENGVAEE